MQEIITGLEIQCLTNWAKLASVSYKIFKLIFHATPHLLHLDNSPKII